MIHPDVTDDLAFDLFARWEDEKARGNTISLEEICARHPEALPDVREIARRLASVAALFPATPEGEPAGTGPAPADREHPDWTEIGRGASSVVYRGQDHTFGTTVAFKVLNPQGRVLSPADLARLMWRFEQEARFLARLKHEGIVRIFKTFGLNGRPVLEMEYLPGGSLHTHLDAVRSRGVAEIVRFVERVARAVGFAHGHRIVHRDLKPSNILLDAAGLPCVSDFGVAKLVAPSEFDSPPPPPGDPGGETDPGSVWLTGVGRQPGTRSYMAPEQFDGAFGPISAATDVWALGVILFELLAGARPFEGEGGTPLADRVCRWPTPPCQSRHGRIPRWLRDVVARCLAKAPGDRYASAAVLAEELRTGLLRARRRAWLAGTVGVLGLSLAAGFAGGKWAPNGFAPGQEPRFEDLPEVTRALARLEGGKEVVLVGADRHAPFRKVFGPETIRKVEADSGPLVLHSHWTGPGAVEFLPRLPPGRYQVSVKIRHDFGGDHSRVGLYVGGRYWESALGRHLGCILLEYRDVGPQAAAAPPAGQDTNCVAELKSLLTGEVQNQVNHWEGLGNRQLRYLAAGVAPPTRTIEMRVTGDGVGAVWEALPVGHLPQFEAAHNLNIFLRGRPEKKPSDRPIDPFAGGVGLIVYNGTATVTDFRITPLK